MMSDFHTVITALINNSDHSRGDIAAACGVSRSTLYGWEVGKLPRDLTKLKKLTDFIGVSLDLVYGPVLKQKIGLYGIDKLETPILPGKTTFGRRLKVLRMWHGETTTELEQFLGVSYRMVHQWEASMARPLDWSHLVRIARRYNATLEYLLVGDVDATWN